MKIISFSDWCEQEILECLEGIKTDCPHCDGHGESECECCGSDTTCVECNGEGKLIITDPSELFNSRSAKAKYKKQVDHDLIKYSRYVGINFILHNNQWLSATTL